MRHDVGGKTPLVTIVTGADRREDTLVRYRGILPQADSTLTTSAISCVVPVLVCCDLIINTRERRLHNG